MRFQKGNSNAKPQAKPVRVKKAIEESNEPKDDDSDIFQISK